MDDPLELGRTTDRRPPFRYSALTRVWFSDTDAQGVVYYGRYLPYFDHARTEYHRHLGSLRIEGAEFVMRASNVEYLAPARFDDLLECFVRVSRIGRTSVTYDVAAYRLPDDELMVTGTQTAVLIDIATRRPVPVPEHAAATGAGVRRLRPELDGLCRREAARERATTATLPLSPFLTCMYAVGGCNPLLEGCVSPERGTRRAVTAARGW